MTAKEITFQLLNDCRPGATFTGYGLMSEVNRMCGENHYPDTYLRYMREYREKTGRQIKNIDKRKSLYAVSGKEAI